MFKAEYIESGTFCASEEETYEAGIEKGEMVVVLTQKEYDWLIGTILSLRGMPPTRSD